MQMSRCCQCLFRILFLVVNLAVAVSTPGQEQEKPDAPQPKPQGTAQPTTGPLSAQAPRAMITGEERVQWAFLQTFGPQSWLNGLFTAGIGTARDHPAAYGPHWEGFAKRYGVRFSGVAASNTIEAGLGALWGEDPRYLPKPGQGFKRRFANVFVGTVMARDRAGRLTPAYARYVAIPGNNFLSNTWRVSGEADTSSALVRTGYGLLAVATSNAWSELWPEVKRKVFNH